MTSETITGTTRLLQQVAQDRELIRRLVEPVHAAQILIRAGERDADLIRRLATLTTKEER